MVGSEVDVDMVSVRVIDLHTSFQLGFLLVERDRERERGIGILRVRACCDYNSLSALSLKGGPPEGIDSLLVPYHFREQILIFYSLIAILYLNLAN